MRILSVFTATARDLPDTCAWCGGEIEIGDDVVDVYGDLYHELCWEEATSDANQIEAWDDGDPDVSVPD
ncbi:MAG: hypothetical protein KatS3mg051_1936 [Anaerolineae bacterium]|nr:MAG: hypothetical protein KatS3mg051_1936 [Anaerolineae bacterium]